MPATFMHLFLAAAAASTAAAVLSSRSEPLSMERVFDSGAQQVRLVGQVNLFTPPRGVPQLRVASAQGGTKFLSCIALPEVCSRLAPNPSAASFEFDAVVVPLAPAVVWPISVTQPGFASLTEAQSRLRYTEYRDYQSSFWHFWAGLAAVMLVFAAWFRTRPLFGDRFNGSASTAKGA